MKTLLLLGGMTPDATTLYYNTINRIARARFGDRHNAPLYLYSATLETMLQYAMAGDWESFAGVYTDAVDTVVGSGQPQGDGQVRASRVDGVVVCAIFAHKIAQQLTAALQPSGIPLLHIADFLASHIKKTYPSVTTLGVLGPLITMQDTSSPDFFIGRLTQPPHNFTVLTPQGKDAEEVNRGMMDEVTKGRDAVRPETKAMFVRQAGALVGRGAGVIVLGSTDLGFVLGQGDLEGVPVVEPAGVHAEGVARWACEEG